jgi:hypothetical protein
VVVHHGGGADEDTAKFGQDEGTTRFFDGGEVGVLEAIKKAL